MGRETLAGLTAYGLPAFGGRATGTPYLGVGQTKVSRLVRVGYRLALAYPDGLELDIEGTRRESTADDAAPEHVVVLRLTLQ